MIVFFVYYLNLKTKKKKYQEKQKLQFLNVKNPLYYGECTDFVFSDARVYSIQLTEDFKNLKYFNRGKMSNNGLSMSLHGFAEFFRKENE